MDLPQVFGRYVLTQRIGEGGMAEVYLASVRVAEGLTKQVVIKKIRKEFADQPEFTRMFVDEAKIALSLNHANLVQVFDFGQVHGAFYLAMELVEGIDIMRLFHAIRSAGDRFPPLIAAYLGHQTAAGLAYAHRKTDDHGHPIGIVHRDVSPHNIMVSYEGQVKILDFGIARTRDRARSVSTSSPRPGGHEETIKGKVAYMSPEQAQGRAVDQRSDVYSLGVVLYELLSNRLLFRTKDRMVALDLVRKKPIVPIRSVTPRLPEALAEIIDRALQRDPTKRYATARAVQSDLRDYLHRADPVVDDEVLANFVARYQQPERPVAAPAPFERPTREVAHSQATPYPRAQRRAAQRVVVVHVALEPRPLVPGDPPIHPGPFLGLVEDIAFKRDATVLRLDEQAAVLGFGALLHTGDDADRAVRAALALREDVGDRAPGLRLGIVVCKASALVGRGDRGTVQVQLRKTVAQQLDATARAFMEGPVMVSGPLVETLSRTWRFGDGRFVESPGAETVSEVDRELEHVAPLLGPAFETKRRVRRLPGAPQLLYGRELELKTLRDTFSEAIRARESRHILVLGEPGVGKRALVERFVASLPRTACWVLRAAGSYTRRNEPLGVFLDLLIRFLGVERTAEPDEIASRLQVHGVRDAPQLAEALASAIGAPATAGSDLDPFTRRDRLWRLIRRLVTALAQRRPVLMITENIHFHDEQSILLVKEWIQNRHPWPILGVTTGRAGNKRVEAVRAEPNVVIVNLGELDQLARRELIVRRFEDPQSAQALADAILPRTGGNPLFIEQVLASLLDQQVIGWNPEGRYLLVQKRGAPIELPPSVEAALLARVEELSRADREVLGGAAVLGRQFRPAELGDLLERSVAKSLENLLERQFLERIQPSAALGDSMRFATVSLHDVCESSLQPDAVKRLHGRAAQLLQQRLDYASERDDGAIADHLMAADRPTEAIEPAMRAAVRAYDLAGNVEAYYHLSQALRAMLGDDPRRWDALLRRERILRAWGRRRAQAADVRQLLRAAHQLVDPKKIVIASIRLLRFYLEVGRIHQAQRLIPRVEARFAALDSDTPFRAVLGELRSELLFMQGNFDAAQRVAREALQYCGTDARGQRQRCRLLRSIGQVNNSVGKYDAARIVYDEALTIAQTIGNQRLEANLLNAMGEVAGRSTHYQEAIERFRAALAIDRDLGDRYATGRKLANLGIAYACIGLLRRAHRFLRKALELHEAVGHPGEFNDVVVHLGEVVAAMGDVDGARALLLDAAQVAATRGDLRMELRARIRLANTLLSPNAPPEDVMAAKTMAEQVLAASRAHGLRTSRCRALQVLSRLAEMEGDLDQAIRLESEAVQLVRAGAAPLDGVRSIHHLGCLLRKTHQREQADDHLREAAAMVQRRLDDLRDEDLRRGYLEQPEAQRILADGGTVAVNDAEAPVAEQNGGMPDQDE